jgi:hypothetical protein
MAGNKTRTTDASVEAYIASRATDRQAADCHALTALFGKLTGEPARMWGPSIVGYGVYRYTYESGRSGEAPLVGFAVRGREIVVYLDCGEGARELLAALGKHRMGKSCLYFRQLADLDVSVLERLVVGSMANTKRLHG